MIKPSIILVRFVQHRCGGFFQLVHQINALTMTFLYSLWLPIESNFFSLFIFWTGRDESNLMYKKKRFTFVWLLNSEWLKFLDQIFFYIFGLANPWNKNLSSKTFPSAVLRFLTDWNLFRMKNIFGNENHDSMVQCIYLLTEKNENHDWNEKK